MSDEHFFLPANAAETLDECAPTERDPSRLAVGTPSRGVALSVLWWLEGDEAHDERRGPHALDDVRAHTRARV